MTLPTVANLARSSARVLVHHRAAYSVARNASTSSSSSSATKQAASAAASTAASAAVNSAKQSAKDTLKEGEANVAEAHDQASAKASEVQGQVRSTATEAEEQARYKAAEVEGQARSKATEAEEQARAKAIDAEFRARAKAASATRSARDAAGITQDKASEVSNETKAKASEVGNEAEAKASSAAESAKDSYNATEARAAHLKAEAEQRTKNKASSSASTVQAARQKSQSSGSSPFGKIVSYSLFLFGSTFLVTYYLDSRSAIHRWVAMPFLHSFVDAEEAQKLAIKLLETGLAPKDYTGETESLETELFGQRLDNPIGLAAGFDKQAEAIDGLFDLGFGIVEVGSVTPQPQPGNPKPRYFRLPSHSASINRFGFNSDGHDVVLSRLLQRVRKHLILNPELIPSDYLPDPRSPDADPRLSRHDAIERAATKLTQDPATVASLLDAHGVPRSLRSGRMLSINLGKNKTSAEADPSDYVKGVHTFGPLADMLVVNVSSPNTPGLRDLQKKEALEALLKSVVEARNALPTRPAAQGSKEAKRVPLVVKISPDLSASELDDVSSTILSSGIDGVIISNTTVQRLEALAAVLPEKERSTLREVGGMSGPPLRSISRQAMQRVAGRLRDGGVEVIAAGGISSPEDVLQASKDGARAVQVYTAFGWQGVGMVARWKEELRALIENGGEGSAAAGAGAKEGTSTTWKLLSHEAQISLAKAEQERKAAQRNAFQQGRSEVKHELDQLKKELGGGGGESSASKPTKARDDGVFRPAQGETAYSELLASARRALGLPEPESETESKPDRQAESAQPTGAASAEANAAAIREKIAALESRKASINPAKASPAPPAVVLQGSGSSSSPTSAVQEGHKVELVGSLDTGKKGYTTGSSSARESGGDGKDWRAWAGVDKARRV